MPQRRYGGELKRGSNDQVSNGSGTHHVLVSTHVKEAHVAMETQEEDLVSLREGPRKAFQMR